MTPTVRARMRHRYDRFAPIIALLAFTIGALGAGFGGAAMLANERQDEQRDMDQSALLLCFDTYAEATSTSSADVREASARRDTALRNVAHQLAGVTSAILGDSADAVARIRKLDRALDRFEEASAALDVARAENPIPEPPSVVCAQETEDVQ